MFLLIKFRNRQFGFYLRIITIVTINHSSTHLFLSLITKNVTSTSYLYQNDSSQTHTFHNTFRTLISLDYLYDAHKTWRQFRKYRASTLHGMCPKNRVWFTFNDDLSSSIFEKSNNFFVYKCCHMVVIPTHHALY